MQVIRRTGPKRKIDYKIPIEAVEYNPKELGKRIAIFDTETDPFLYGRVVKPFTCGFYIPDSDEYFDFWGDDCIEQFFVFLAKEFPNEEFCIFVHNGGNFDFYFFVDYFDNGHSPFIINGRLVKVTAQGQEFRDSYSMIPVALGEYDKLKIDYRCLERGFRDVFKETIREYQKRDCTSLGELVVAWLDMFGSKLTMASVALPMLRSYHGFETLSENLDNELRPYYFGGRNQCFTTGVLKGDFKVYDINSSYPDVMARYQHPISDIPKYDNRITDKTHFAHIRAWSLGALPIRAANGGLAFPIGTNDFFACIHEINAGLATGTLRILKVYSSIYFEDETNFSEFISAFYKLRLDAGLSGDEIKKLFYKLVMNSSYGKFAQDPRKYENWLFDPLEIPTPFYCGDCHGRVKRKEKPEPCALCEAKTHSPYGWYLHTRRDEFNLYAQPQRIRSGSFFNVATAASITSAARASLLYGIKAAVRPVYCDTDSVICEAIDESAVKLHPSDLGAWDLEATGSTVCIAGKKLYAIFDADGKLVKKASKGVKLSGAEIRSICEGEKVEYMHPVPKFSLTGETKFTKRNISRTG